LKDAYAPSYSRGRTASSPVTRAPTRSWTAYAAETAVFPGAPTMRQSLHAQPARAPVSEPPATPSDQVAVTVAQTFAIGLDPQKNNFVMLIFDTKSDGRRLRPRCQGRKGSSRGARQACQCRAGASGQARRNIAAAAHQFHSSAKQNRRVARATRRDLCLCGMLTGGSRSAAD